jgi:hypothetical protein
MKSAEQWVFRDRRTTPPTLWSVKRQAGRLYLSRGGARDHKLPPLESQLLEYLLIGAGRPVKRTELEKKLWPDGLEAHLDQPLNALRAALDDHEGHLLITVEKRPTIYQFLERLDDLLETPDEEIDPLQLTTLHDLRRLPPARSDRKEQLLNPRRCAIPFVGRGEEADALWRWLAGEDPVSFKVITGQGGRGKTRLAIRLLELLEEPDPRRWHAGFLEPELSKRVLTFETFKTWRSSRPTLIVIDYASLCAESLQEVVRALRSHQVDGMPALRFLLIDRGVDGGSSGYFRWYHNLINAAGDAQFIFTPPLNLETLTDEGDELDTGDRFQLLDSALLALHELDGQSRLTINSDARHNLAAPHMGDPLVIIMAAIVGHDLRDLSPLTYGRTDLADILAGREEYRITALARPQSDLLPLHLAACVTLTRGMDAHDFTLACQGEKRALEPDSNWETLALQNLVSEKALPSDNPAVAAAAVVPDVVGELFVERILAARHQQPAETIARMFESDSDSVELTLINLLDDLTPSEESSVKIASRRQRVVGWIEQAIQLLLGRTQLLKEQEKTAETLTFIERVTTFAFKVAVNVPIQLIPIAASSCQMWGDILIAQGNAHDASQKYVHGLLMIKPLALSVEGYWNQAVSLATLSYETHKLTNTPFDKSFAMPFYALLPSGDHDIEASHMIDELLRRTPLPLRAECVAQLRPLYSGPSCATVLQNGLRHIEACQKGHPRTLSDEGADWFADLAMDWWRAGFARESLAAANEAISILSRLATEERAHYLPRLAYSLSVRADSYAKLAKYTDALAAISEAVASFMECNDAADTYSRHLAWALYKNGLLAWRDNKKQAAALLEEACTFARRVSLKDRRFTWEWTEMHHALSVLTVELGRVEKALEVRWEEDATVRRLFPEGQHAVLNSRTVRSEGSVAYLAQMPVDSYYGLGLTYRDRYAGEFRRALKFRIDAEFNWWRWRRGTTAPQVLMEQAVRDARWLVECDRPRFMPLLLDLLTCQARLTRWAGNIDGSINASSEAVTLSDEVHGGDELATKEAHLNRELALAAKMQHSAADAVAAATELVDHCRRLLNVDQSRFLPYLADALSLRADLYEHNGSMADAVISARDAVRVYRDVAATKPWYNERLAEALHGQAALEMTNKLNADALASTGEAIELYLVIAGQIRGQQYLTLASLLARQVSLLALIEDGEATTVTLNRIDDQISWLRNLANWVAGHQESSDPERQLYRIAVLDARWARILCLRKMNGYTSEHRDDMLQSFVSVADQYKELQRQNVAAGQVLASVYAVWADALCDESLLLDHEPQLLEAARKLEASLRAILLSIVSAASSREAPAQALAIGDSYLVACEKSGLPTDPELLESLSKLRSSGASTG